MTSAPKDSQPAAQVSPNETTTEGIRAAGLPGSEPEAPVSSSPADTPAIPARSFADDAAPEGGAVADAARTKPVRPAGLAGLRIQIGSLRDSSLVPKPKPQPIHESERQARSEPPSAVERETSVPEAADRIPPGAPARTRILPPNVRDRLSPELEREVAAALGSMSLDQLIDGTGTDAGEAPIEPESQIEGRVVAVGREELFLDLGGRNQGVMPLRQFDTPPEPGATLDVIVHRFDPEDGLYEVSLPGAAADVSDWSQVTEGLIVDATITGHNTGGLECQVGSLQGFIPLSQVSLYRVEEVDEYIGQKFSCLVTQANPFRRNLVLSRRAVLERECAEARQRLWEELEVGQTREGIVRNLKEFGAFVDLGGVDGLIHISQLSWDRIGHPSEVLELGQKVRVKIQQIDRTEGKISLAYRDLSENPWTGVARKYPVSSCVNGTVVKIMDFGALVRLEPGIVGLIHISELSHARVWRVADVVHVGQEVEVKVLSVDADGQRIGLSRRALELPPEVEKEQTRSEERMAAAVEEGGMKLPKTAPQQLKGGLGRSAGGERFGLKW